MSWRMGRSGRTAPLLAFGPTVCVQGRGENQRHYDDQDDLHALLLMEHVFYCHYSTSVLPWQESICLFSRVEPRAMCVFCPTLVRKLRGTRRVALSLDGLRRAGREREADLTGTLCVMGRLKMPDPRRACSWREATCHRRATIIAGRLTALYNRMRSIPRG